MGIIRGRHFTVNTFKCTVCGKEGIPISRKQSNQREYGHLEKALLRTLQKETNHVEIREFDYTDQFLYAQTPQSILEGKKMVNMKIG